MKEKLNRIPDSLRSSGGQLVYQQQQDTITQKKKEEAGRHYTLQEQSKCVIKLDATKKKDTPFDLIAGKDAHATVHKIFSCLRGAEKCSLPHDVTAQNYVRRLTTNQPRPSLIKHACR